MEVAIVKLANEMLDDATTLADFARSLSHELFRGQQLELLHRLTGIASRIHRTTEMLCNDSDKNREIPR